MWITKTVTVDGRRSGKGEFADGVILMWFDTKTARPDVCEVFVSLYKKKE
jgi:hypothetical protein